MSRSAKTHPNNVVGNWKTKRVCHFSKWGHHTDLLRQLELCTEVPLPPLYCLMVRLIPLKLK